MVRSDHQSLYVRIYDEVRRIPPGRVATYGQIAKEADVQGQARLVGYALHALPPESKIPWHRVINAKGEISQLPDPDSGITQRILLEAEGIVFDERGRISLERFGSIRSPVSRVRQSKLKTG